MKSDIKYIMLAVGDILELIEKANAAIERHKHAENPSQSILEQYQDLRNEYLGQLAELLKDFDIKIEIPDKAA
jgi:signal recognition particle GTPase